MLSKCCRGQQARNAASFAGGGKTAGRIGTGIGRYDKMKASGGHSRRLHLDLNTEASEKAEVARATGAFDLMR
jgi:hypothetical protein